MARHEPVHRRGMPLAPLLRKMEVTDMVYPESLGYRAFAIEHLMYSGPDEPYLESEQWGKTRLAESVLTHRYAGMRGGEEPRHPDLFVGFTGDDPRGATLGPRLEGYRAHSQARGGNHEVRMGHNVGYGAEQVVEQPWSSHGLRAGLKTLHGRMRDLHLKIFIASKTNHRQADPFQARPYGRRDTRAAAQQRSDEGFSWATRWAQHEAPGAARGRVTAAGAAWRRSAAASATARHGSSARAGTRHATRTGGRHVLRLEGGQDPLGAGPPGAGAQAVRGRRGPTATRPGAGQTSTTRMGAQAAARRTGAGARRMALPARPRTADPRATMNPGESERAAPQRRAGARHMALPARPRTATPRGAMNPGESERGPMLRRAAAPAFRGHTGAAAAPDHGATASHLGWAGRLNGFGASGGGRARVLQQSRSSGTGAA